MFKVIQGTWIWALNLFKKDGHRDPTETAEERGAEKITEAVSNIDIFLVNSPTIKCGYSILTLNEFSKSQSTPIVIDCRNETILATKKYLKIKKGKNINPQQIIDAKEEIKKALNQPAKVVIKKRSGKIEPRFIIILYPTNQQPETLLFTTSNRRSPKSFGFEMEKKNILWSWQIDKEPETSGVFLIKII